MKQAGTVRNLAAAASLLALAVPVAASCAPLQAAAERITGRSAALRDLDVLKGAPIELKAYAIAAWWSVLQSEAADLAADPATPEAIRKAVQRIDRAGSPVVLALIDRTEAYVAAGGSRTRQAEELVRAAAAAEGPVTTLAALLGVEAPAFDGASDRETIHDK